MANQEFTTEELETEEWRDVVGYEGIYSVSNLGRLRTAVARKGYKSGHLLKPNTSKKGKGYPKTTLSRSSVRQTVLVHQLVAQAFLGNCPLGYTVNHKDTIKTNNRFSNLEYQTPQGQMDHAKSMGVLACGRQNGKYTHADRRASGDNHPMTRYSDATVKEIRHKFPLSGLTQSAFADLYGMAQPTLSSILLNKARSKGVYEKS